VPVATTPPSSAAGDPPATHTAAEELAVDLARKAALLDALGGLSRATDFGLSQVVGSLGLVTTSDHQQLLAALTAADTATTAAASTLSADGVTISPEGALAVAPLSVADQAAAAGGTTISVSPMDYVFGLDDLVNRDGRPPTPPRNPVVPATLAAALTLLVATFGGTATTTTTVPAATAPSASTTPGWILPVIIAVVVVGLVIGALLVTRRRRTPPRPGVDPTAVTAVAGPSAPTVASNVHELLDVSRRMALVGDEDVPRAIAREAMGLVRARTAAVVLRRGGELTVGYEGEPDLLRPERLGEGVIGRVADTGQPSLQVSATEPGVRNLPVALVAVPLVVAGTVSAVLVLIREETQPFSAGERDLLVALAPVAAATMHSAAQSAATREESLSDPLTGVGNRRRLESELPGLLARDGAVPTAVVMLDLDHFKAVNDTHGHPAGDAVLRATAGVIGETVRPGDRVYRYGGEEFILVLPATTAAEAGPVAERVRAAVEAAVVDIGGADPLRVTASLGLAFASADSPAGTDAGEVVRRADEALYRAKAGGRNQVAVAGD
jgi:diguanylate cyclase (GGDEF)-like protein